MSLVFCFSQDSIYISNLDTTFFYSAIQLTKQDSIVDKALEYNGVRYAYGGMGRNGMDCSGLICLAFKNVNIEVPHGSSSLAQMGESIEADNLAKGDLIFFQGRSSNSIGHVAIVSKIVDGLIYIVHATSSRGVMEEILQYNDYFMKRWLFNKRLID